MDAMVSTMISDEISDKVQARCMNALSTVFTARPTDSARAFVRAVPTTYHGIKTAPRTRLWRVWENLRRVEFDCPDNLQEKRKTLLDIYNNAKRGTIKDFNKNWESWTPTAAGEQEQPNQLKSFKMSTWNIDGLRSKVENLCKYLREENPTTMFISEIRDTVHDLQANAETDVRMRLSSLRYPYVYWHWNVCPRTGTRNWGCMMASRIKPISVKYGIDDEMFDREGRAITLEFPWFYEVGVYAPCTTKNVQEPEKRRLRWEQLLREHVAKLSKKKPVCLVGDLNVCPEMRDMKGIKNPTHMPSSKEWERKELEKMKNERKLTDLWRHLHPDTQAFTWEMKGRDRTQQRIDLHLIDNALLGHGTPGILITSCIHNAKIKGSDHIPV